MFVARGDYVHCWVVGETVVNPDPEFILSPSMPPEKIGEVLMRMPDRSKAEFVDGFDVVTIEKIIPEPYSMAYSGIVEIKLEMSGRSGIIDMIRTAIGTIPQFKESSELSPYHKNGMMYLHLYFYPKIDS